MIIHLTQTKAALMGGPAAVIGAWISELFGGWDTAIVTLILFMALDYISGLVVAGVFHRSDKEQASPGKLDSTACWQGLLKKGMTIVVVLVAAQLDSVLGTSFVREAASHRTISLMRLISIIENAGRMGLPVPDALMKAIEQLQGKGKDT